MNNITALIQKSTEKLQSVGITNAFLEARILLEFATKRTREEIFLAEFRLTEEEIKLYQQLIKRRLKREPIAYIIGKKEFFGWEFIVNPYVLIPRPETELIIETAKSYYASDQPLSILDIGTGSGCLAVSLLKLWPKAKVWAVDISAAALEVAQLNASNLGVNERIEFLHMDCRNFESSMSFDLIVSNPPYINTNDYFSLSQDILNYEPHIALFAAEEGLEYYEKLASIGQNFLTNTGYMIIECGYNQLPQITKFFAQVNMPLLESRKDLAGFERVAVYSVASSY